MLNFDVMLKKFCVRIYKLAFHTELMNIQLFELAKTYHAALAKVDISTYAEGKFKLII